MCYVVLWHCFCNKTCKGGLCEDGALAARRRRGGGEAGGGAGDPYQTLVGDHLVVILIIINIIIINIMCAKDNFVSRYMTSGSGSHSHSQVDSWDPRCFIFVISNISTIRIINNLVYCMIINNQYEQ